MKIKQVDIKVTDGLLLDVRSKKISTHLWCFLAAQHLNPFLYFGNPPSNSLAEDRTPATMRWEWWRLRFSLRSLTARVRAHGPGYSNQTHQPQTFTGIWYQRIRGPQRVHAGSKMWLPWPVKPSQLVVVV